MPSDASPAASPFTRLCQLAEVPPANFFSYFSTFFPSTELSVQIKTAMAQRKVGVRGHFTLEFLKIPM